ncbi:tetratricopeptide repeat [Paramuricea clavata]|uniref:Tetratricopeptide repeat n=1 Tax=Paramuricea clavata TaxID=317549 RepID=A0A6S7JHR2_PARCT|nr:tetratricopeptide repeat [Paramuricea clavata]
MIAFLIFDLDTVVENYDTDTIKTSSTSDDAHLRDETVHNVKQTDIENRSIPVGSVEQLLILGISHETEGRNEEAIKSYKQVVQIADETDRNDIKSKAYQHLGNVFTGPSEYKKAIEYYQKAREISPDLEGNELEIEAYQWLAYNHIRAGQYQESREYYNEVVKLASQLGDKKRKINAYLGLGSAFHYTGDFESSRRYFLKALTVAEQLHDKILQKEAYRNLGAVYYNNYKFDAAVKSYLKVKEISHDLGEIEEEANACLMLGDTFQELKQHEEAIESYQETLNICEELEDKEMQIVAIQRLGTLYLVCCKDCDYENAVEWYEKGIKILGSQPNDHLLHVKALTGLGDEELDDKVMQAVAIQRLGTLYLTLASICCKDGDYEKAITWYENALNISGKEINDNRLLHEKALTGLGTTWFRLGDTGKAMESIQKAQKFVKDTRTNSSNIETPQENKNSTEQKASPSSAVQDSKEVHGTHAQESPPELQASSSQERGAIEDKELENVVMFEEKEPEITGGRQRAEELVEEEACNPNRTEGYSLEELVLMEKYVKISPSYVYSRQILPKEPFTKKVSNIMTENVKALAYTTFLGKNDDKPRGNDGKFDNRDQQLFNFAKSKVFKNASTQKPAKLNENLVLYMRSIARIVCGGVPCGTCFLVADALVITNYHVYRMIKDERTKLGNPNLPITVQFDYLDPEQTEHIVCVEVDEERNTTLENPYLDYKLFPLKQSLNGRVLLGPMVRNWKLPNGLVVILGHPGTKEMREEVCTVIGVSSIHETMRKRHEVCTGVHMTNLQLLQEIECQLPNVEDCLSYDTTLFHGSSGSPVIDMNGNIVAMHTQGYRMYGVEENISNQQNLRKYSLMEFGVQFTSIYRDMLQWGDEIVKQIFPNCNEPMDVI